MASISLPTLPWHDVRGDGAEMPRSCLGWLVFAWAWGFIFLLLVGATHGVTFVGLRLRNQPGPNAWQWLLLVISVSFFVYVEALQGFHRRWSPWVVRRCLILHGALRRSPGSLLAAILAPFFAMGFFCASRRRLVMAYTLYPAIVLLIVLVKHLPSPYHEIVDLGVAAGIGLGTLTFVYHLVVALKTQTLPPDDGARHDDGGLAEPMLA